MKIKFKAILIIVITLIVGYLIFYLSSWLYIEYNIKKNDKEFFRRWEKETFFPNSYVLVVTGCQKLYYDNNKYLNIYHISHNNDIKETNLIIRKINIIKEGDTIIKPKNSNKLYLIKQGKRINLEYKWSWDTIQ